MYKKIKILTTSLSLGAILVSASCGLVSCGHKGSSKKDQDWNKFLTAAQDDIKNNITKIVAASIPMGWNLHNDSDEIAQVKVSTNIKDESVSVIIGNYSTRNESEFTINYVIDTPYVISRWLSSTVSNWGFGAFMDDAYNSVFTVNGGKMSDNLKKILDASGINYDPSIYTSYTMSKGYGWLNPLWSFPAVTNAVKKQKYNGIIKLEVAAHRKDAVDQIDITSLYLESDQTKYSIKNFFENI